MSLKQKFSNRTGGKAQFQLTELVKNLDEQRELSGGVFNSANHGMVETISSESFDSMNHEQQELCMNLYDNLERMLQDVGFENFNTGRGEDGVRVSENQKVAASMAAIAGADEVRYRKALRGVARKPTSADPNVIAISPMFDGPAGSISATVGDIGMENYNEKATRDFRVISVAYNLAASRQDAFGEAIYPTVVVNPTEGGVTQNLTYAAVMRDVFHEVTGQLFDTREVNMVEAFRDPKVLEDASTKIVPVVDEQGRNANVFVDPDVIAPRDIVLERGGQVQTAPLKPGAKFDLMGISNRQQLINSNLLDISDTIDPALRLSVIYARLGTSAGSKVIKFFVERMPTAVFQPSLVDDTRIAQLNFHTEDLVLSADSRAIDGSTGAGLDAIVNGGLTVRLSAAVNGRVWLAKGDTQIQATDLVVEQVFNDAGERLSLESGEGASLVTTLGDIQVIGYDLDARFTNTNRRERGQLVQTRTLQFRYPIPMHSPITLPMSTMDENGPGDVVKTLTVATNIRNSNNAVTRLLNYLAQLREVVSAGYDRPKFGAVEGALSAMIRPTYRYTSLDLRDVIDTIRSQDRWEDVTQAILNTIKAQLFPAYRDSNIEAAFQTVTGNADERPKFIIATDKEIANYLMMKGDDRTLGAYLKYDIVSTNNETFDGKIVVIPTRENPVENDILNFGQFYYVPTIVADLPISRHGQVSREIAAIPFNLHVNNIPFAIEIDVSGLREVMGQSQYNSLPGLNYAGDTSGGETTTSGDTSTSGDTTTTP